MSYCTRYTITRIDGDAAAFRRAFERHPVADKEGYGWFGIAEASDSQTWYEHDQHIADAMLEAGTELVLLHGEGEQQGDVWDKEYRRLTPKRGAVAVKTFKYKLVREEAAETVIEQKHSKKKER